MRLIALSFVAVLALAGCTASVNSVIADACRAVPIADAAFQAAAELHGASLSARTIEARAVADAQALCAAPVTDEASALAALQRLLATIRAQQPHAA